MPVKEAITFTIRHAFSAVTNPENRLTTSFDFSEGDFLYLLVGCHFYPARLQSYVARRCVGIDNYHLKARGQRQQYFDHR
ncbi:hypothetical protein MJ581_11370 [Escherichia coli]|nr:hypothetical protein MJ581_11370 [Escherichia coli]